MKFRLTGQSLGSKVIVNFRFSKKKGSSIGEVEFLRIIDREEKRNKEQCVPVSVLFVLYFVN